MNPGPHVDRGYSGTALAMPDRRASWLAMCFWLSTALLVFVACRERAPDAGKTHDAGAPREYLPLATNEVDTSNRYPWAVTVTAHASMSEGGEVECSGVLIAPHAVLTLSPCVCPQPKALGEQECATAVTVTSVLYDPPNAVEDLSSTNKEYRGSARSHPGGAPKTEPEGMAPSPPQLALILLEKPVKNLTPVKVADAEAEEGELIIVVGYARDEASGGLGRKRHFAQGRVAKARVAGNGAFQVKPSLHRVASDIGGPCLRDNGQGPMLIGILSAASEEGTACTSLSPYRKWLSDELQRAATAEKGPRPGP